MTKPGSIIAASTSLVSANQLAPTPLRTESIVGLHRHNPVPALSLVETVCRMGASDATNETALQPAQTIGNAPMTDGGKFEHLFGDQSLTSSLLANSLHANFRNSLALAFAAPGAAILAKLTPFYRMGADL